MYHYTFANIFMYCYERKIDFESLAKRISIKKEKEYLNSLPYIKDMACNQIWSLESEINILSEELRISAELLIFPPNYTQKVLNFIKTFDFDFECETVSFDPEDMSWRIWMPISDNNNRFFLNILRNVNADNMKYEYLINIIMPGLDVQLMGNCIGIDVVIYNSEIGERIEEIDGYINNIIDKMEMVDAKTEKPIINPGISLDFKNVIVKTSFRKCEKDNHDICIRNAIIYILNNTTHQIVPETLPLLYCKDCNVYYMYEDQYITLTKKGRILCRVYNTKQWQESGHTTDLFGSLNMESIFKICGYRVDANSNIPDQARHSLLDFIIQRNIVNLNQTLNFLHWLISIKKDMPHMRNAVEKWKNDLNYINNKYQEDVKAVTVKSIRR